MLTEFYELESYCFTAKEAKLWMGNICGPHELDVWGRDPLVFHHKGNRFPGLEIVTGLLSYGCNVAINIDPDNSLKGYSISLPLSGHQKLRSEGVELYSNEEQGIIVSPTSPQELEISSDCQKLQLMIPSRSVMYVAEKLIGQIVTHPVQFDAKMDLKCPEIKAWWYVIQQTVKHWQSIQALYNHPQMMRDLEFSFIKGLLLSQPNNIRQQLKESLLGDSSRSIPAYLTRACEWMKKNAHTKIYIEDISAYVGVSRFVLFSGFRNYFNDTPLGWLKNHRMHQVRYALMNSNNRTKVSNIAMEWGFNHFGRFSQQYQEHFGELPSETLLKYRNH